MTAPWLDDGDVRLFHGGALDVLRSLAAGSVQTCVTSPPFFQLRDYGVDGQIGLEATVGDYVDRLVDVFRAVRRVLRDDATLWLELGDSYLPGKQLAGVPWTVAFALQTDGWVLRADVVWSRPNPMPESVSDRPTKSHSYVFLLAKQPKYFFDSDAIREPNAPSCQDEGKRMMRWVDNKTDASRKDGTGGGLHAAGQNGAHYNGMGRNARSVWTVATQPTPEAHFATMPEALVGRCILAGTSERGECSACGSPWRRVLGERTAVGWEPTCECGDLSLAVPQTVLDPFVGSGTTALVARKHGRRAVGIDLSADYLAIAARRLGQQSLFATSEGAA